MPPPSPVTFFKLSLKSESYYADEIINIYLLRPIAACVVWLLHPTRITPNQVTVSAILVGFIAAYVYNLGTSTAVALGGLLITLKDILDDADGQLARLRAETAACTNRFGEGRHYGVQARAKELYSRRGRFLDSVGDFVVNVAVFGAVTGVVYQKNPNVWVIVMGILSLAGITLRVSCHVFYQVSFLHLEDRYKLNRITEKITEEDRQGDLIAFRLQQIFLLIYGWQDRLMYAIDSWCRRGKNDRDFLNSWYSDKFSLRLSGLLGFGTEFAVLTICSLFNNLSLYLLLNIVLMNGIWMINILYRRYILSMKI